MRWSDESGLYACVATRPEMEVESSFWWVWSAVAVSVTDASVEGWEKIAFK